MAASRRPGTAPRGPSLRALTAAAFALPGLAPGRAQGAGGDEVSFQYGRYTEDERDLAGVDSAYDPIRVDNLMAGARFSLVDRWSLAFMYEQDTWSGATPVTTAPLVFGGNRASSLDAVSGATPFIEGDLYLNGDFDPLRVDELGRVGEADSSLVHTLSSASPETRQQLGATLGYAFERPVEVSLGGGLSLESDYESVFGELGGAFEFDRRLFRLEGSLSYTHAETDALLDPDAVPYIDTSAYGDDVEIFPSTGNRKLSGDSDEVGLRLVLSRVLSRDTLVSLGFGYARASGFLENPYKVVEVAFVDPAQQGQAPPGGYYAQVHALLEQRPNSRNQWSADLRLVQYVAPLDAALHLSYGFYADDWGVDAHTFEASLAQPLGLGLTLTPRVRFYSQSEADFYDGYLISQQAYRTIVTDPDTGDIVSITPFDPSLLPSHFSSDARLSGFGALSGGATLSLRFAQGIVLDGGFEYYAHRGGWRLGGGGEGDYADFDSYLLSAGLRLDTSALGALAATQKSEDPEEPRGPHAHAFAAQTPAGVMLGHMLPARGDWMFGLRYGWARQDGDVLHGTGRAGDEEIAARGCGDIACVSAPKSMTTQMIMVELGFAPTSWLNLMLMPSFAAMKMDLRPLDGAEPDVHGSHDGESGGVGDTGVFALVELFETQGHSLHAGVGVGAPSGSVDEKSDRSHQQERGYTHYGMQLGSGTWDLLPSLTYTGTWRRFSFGGQLSGTLRLEDENDSGYALGDVFQATGWAGFALTRWLSATARGLYSWQGRIRHQYDRRHDESGPMDFPGNYGGQYVDLGLGLSASATSGPLAGQRLALEWLQPLRDDVNGYQLERVGSLQASWSLAF